MVLSGISLFVILHYGYPIKRKLVLINKDIIHHQFKYFYKRVVSGCTLICTFSTEELMLMLFGANLMNIIILFIKTLLIKILVLSETIRIIFERIFLQSLILLLQICKRILNCFLMFYNTNHVNDQLYETMVGKEMSY